MSVVAFTLDSLGGVIGSITNIIYAFYVTFDNIIIVNTPSGGISLFTFGVFSIAISLAIMIYLRFRTSPSL